MTSSITNPTNLSIASANACVVLCPDLFEDSWFLQNLLSSFSKEGILTRGCKEDEKVEDVLQECRKAYGTLPILLYGKGMGALFALEVLQKQEALIDGCILVGMPEHFGQIKIPTWQGMILSYVKGKQGFSTSFEKKLFASFPEESLAGTYTLEQLQSFAKTFEKVQQVSQYQCHQPHLPILVIQQGEPGRMSQEGPSWLVLKQAGYERIQDLSCPWNSSSGHLLARSICEWVLNRKREVTP